MIRKVIIHKSRLITAAGIIIGLILTTLFFISNITSTVALEQEARCGMNEHIHTEECYTDNVLTCTIAEHNHDKNCYLVLLKENDVNEIMKQAEDDESNSLNSVIDKVVESAINHNSGFNSKKNEIVNNQNISFDKTIVSLLNSTIKSEKSIPKIMLNENINTFSSSSLLYNAGMSVKSVGDEPQTGNYNANFFIYLDGSWQCIGTSTFAIPSSYLRYVPTMSTESILNLINTSLGTQYTENSFLLYYSASADSTSWSKASIGSQNTTFGSSTNSATARATKYVRVVSTGAGNGNDTSFAFNTVIYNYPDGRSEKFYVRSGTSITLPAENYIWIDSKGNEYGAGDSVPIVSRSEFTAVDSGSVSEVNIMYDVNFPTLDGISVDTVPTISGTTNSMVTDVISEKSSTVVRNVSQSTIKGKMIGAANDLSRIINFKGWNIAGTEIILAPNTSLTWGEMLSYSKNGVIRLNASWEYDPRQTCTFFIRYDSVAVDVDGNVTDQDQNHYTKELFASYVGGVDLSKGYWELDNLYKIADTTADNSYTADQNIRALYGPKSEGVWLASFPDDEYIFQQLKNYASYLSVEGRPVATENLHSNAYAIRWYVFKDQADAWHIDGKLVPKVGIFQVTKTFAGNKELIEKAKQSFYIEASNESLSRNERLDLTNYSTYDENTQKYTWDISNVQYGELWNITEHAHIDGNADFYAYSEYDVVDPYDEQSKTGTDTTLTIKGGTYALDDDNGVLRVEFTNIYNKKSAIIIRKQDNRTGDAIAGAEFKLLQNGQPLTFDYDAQKECYIFNPTTGNITNLKGSDNGYFELSIEDFSYDLGPITICETKPPEGYAPISDTVIGYTDSQNKDIGLISGDIDLVKYAGGILIVDNNSDTISAVVNKTWDCPESEWVDVDVQLLADNKLITTLVSGIVPSVTLSSENNWSYRWNNLPVYINGKKVNYSVRETRIGNENCKSDSNFVNWIASYDPPVYSTETDGGSLVTLNVTNTTKRVLLRLTKMDTAMTKRLPDAEFLLEAVDDNGEHIAGEISKTQKTGSNGTLTFDNLKCGIRYKLTETSPPDGYNQLYDPVFLTINEDGTINMDNHPYAFAGSSAFNIVVCDQQAVPLPTTGGHGYLFYITGGIFIMMIAVCVIIKKYLLKGGIYN